MQSVSRKKLERMWIFIFIAPTVLVFLALYLWPLMLALFSSFTQWNGFTAMKFVGFGNYAELFQDPNFRQATLNTLYSAMWGAFVHVPVGVILALVLSRKPRGWRFVRSAYMLPNIISGAGLALLFIFIYKPDSGVIASILKAFGLPGNQNWLLSPNTAFMAVTHMWLWYAAVITLITLAELLSVSPEIYESAHIDGANNFQIDWHINLPLIKRIIGTGIIITVTSVFKTFDIIYMTTQGGPGNKTLNLAVMMVNNVTKQTKYGYSNAIGVILLLLGAIVMLINTTLFRMGKED
jgi:raffinose/stachyose/melibiose transport system permease protein